MDAVTAIKEAAADIERKNNILEIIAQKKLGIKTLEVRNSDSLDFYDLGVASIRDALEEALKIGIEIGLTLNTKGAGR